MCEIEFDGRKRFSNPPVAVVVVSKSNLIVWFRALSSAVFPLPHAPSQPACQPERRLPRATRYDARVNHTPTARERVAQDRRGVVKERERERGAEQG
jgi:hypothetical protein